MDIDYRKYHRDNEYQENEKLFRNIFNKRYKIIQPYLVKDSRGRVLDIGCSNGVFLDIFKDKGYETWGVEPSKIGDKAQLKGYKVIRQYFEKAKLPHDYFDLVIMNHTLEHLKNPQKILTKITTLLKKNGILYIDVPNVGSLSSRILGKHWPYLLPKEHLWQFDKKSLTELLNRNGFSVLHWESRSGIFEYLNPFLELRRKRFLIDLLFIPYYLLATTLGMGDSMSFICKKI
jgi:SAM-dependent methyltransferase